MKFSKEAAQIIQAVGGKGNIKDVFFCATRLRFELNDLGRADQKKLEAISGVQGVVLRTSQLQLIIGQGVVEQYHAAVKEQLDKTLSGVSAQVAQPKAKFSVKNLFGTLLDTLSSIFSAIIPAIAGSGMIMGIVFSLQIMGIVGPESALAKILITFGNAAFYFLPIYLAFSSAKRFGCNSFVAAVLGGILIHPTFVGMVSAGDSLIQLGFIKINLLNYGSSVVPIILSVYLMSWIEKGLKRIVPKMIDIIVTPTLSILITGVLSLWIIAPLGQNIGNFVASALLMVHDKFGALGGMLLGLTYPFILATGMQVSFTPIIAMNLQSLGYDFIYTFIAPSNAAMAAAAIYIFFKAGNKETKSVAGSTGISALIGVTEPVFFGLVAKYRKVLYAVMAGGAVGGLVMGLFKVRYMGFGFVPFGTIILAFGPTFVYYLLGVAAAMGVTLAMLIFTGYESKESVGNPAPGRKAAELKSPVKGKVIPLSQVNDPSFSKGYLGKGIAVAPADNVIYAPCNGKIMHLNGAKHAIAILSDDNAEILIHVGIDTVKLGGAGFTAHVSEGDYIEAGDKLLTVDLEELKSKGFDPTVMMVVTNSEHYAVETAKAGALTEPKQNLIEIQERQV